MGIDRVRAGYRGRWALVASIVVTTALAGCFGRPGRLRPPELKPAEVGAEAVRLLDKNSDSRIDQDEAAASPALLAAFDRCDTSPADKALTADEISGRLQRMIDSRVGMMPCYATVTLNSTPLVGATVKLIPDPLLGEAIAAAEGVTDDRGEARPQMVGAEPGTPGVQFGWYRVEITHPDVQLPARYNTESTLGMEISPLERDSDHKAFALTTRP